MLAVVAAVVATLVVGGVYLPYRGFRDEVFIDIPRGTGTRQISAQLARAGVIRYPWQLLVVRAMRPSVRLQAGEYRFKDSATPAQIFDRLVAGDVFYYEVTVPEGSNIFDIAAIVEQSDVVSGDDFVKAAADVKLIQDLDPKAHTLEGYLFPSTYRIVRTTTAAQLARQMTDEFRKEWKKLTAAAAAPPDTHDTVTLASLIEKETGVAAERPTVASVYTNRLRIGMKLDCDPTTIYAALLEARYRGTIHRSDLANQNAYNTYQHAGLPPGPITNPGIASLQAAIAPAETKFLYFVAKTDGSGSHTFSTDYASHTHAVEAYRRAQSKAGQAR